MEMRPEEETRSSLAMTYNPQLLDPVTRTLTLIGFWMAAILEVKSGSASGKVTVGEPSVNVAFAAEAGLETQKKNKRTDPNPETKLRRRVGPSVDRLNTMITRFED